MFSKIFFWSVLAILAITTTFLFSRCSNSSKSELAVYKSLNVSLEMSNLSLYKSTEHYFASFEERLSDPSRTAKAAIYQPRAMAVSKISEELHQFVESIKWELKKEAGMKNDQDIEGFKADDRDAVVYLFEGKKKGMELQQRLKKYKKDVFAVDSQLDSAFNGWVAASAWTEEGADYIVKNCFRQVPAIAALAMLNKIQNDVLLTENSMVSFFHNKSSGYAIHDHYMYAAIVGQSNSILKPGERLEITAGVGSFSMVAKPEIQVRGKKIDLDPSGTFTYKMKVPAKAGKYFVPVKIQYTNEDGKIEVVQKNVEYTVQDISCPDN